MRHVGAAYVRPEDGCEVQIALPRRDDPREWHKDHSAWAVHIHLPEIRPHALAWRLAAEAYLTRVRFTGHARTRAEIELEKVWGHNPTREWSFEQALSDGTSVAADFEYHAAKIKDPASQPHDLGYFLHKAKLADVFGKQWGLCELHSAYADIISSDGRPILARWRQSVLLVAGWKPYYFGEALPEPVEAIEWHGVSDNRLSKWVTGNIVANGHVPFRSRGISEPPRTDFT